jgi:hypothetical protein
VTADGGHALACIGMLYQSALVDLTRHGLSQLNHRQRVIAAPVLSVLKYQLCGIL